MKIQRIKTVHNNDFTADMECEHCGHVQHLATGYNDSHYALHVIPAMTCQKCGKNRAGDTHLPNPNGTVHVSGVSPNG